MFLYLLKRILLFAPTLLLVSLLSFGLSKCSPGDPVVQYLGEDVFVKYSTPQDLVNAEKSYLQAAKDLGIDRPAFYCSVRPLAYPDTLYRIVHAQRRTALEKLTAQYGNWPQVQAWQGAVRSFDLQLLGLTDSLQRATSTPIKQPLRELYLLHEHGAMSARLQELEAAFGKTPALAASLGTAFFTLKKSYETMRAEATPGKLWLPALHWYGLDNQYHRWLTRFFRGDFGVSLEKLPVAQKVKPALFWTLVVSLPAIVLAFLLAVPIGAWSAVKRGKAFDKIATTTVFMLYSMPVFWVATVLLVFFTNREYCMNIFPGKFPDDIPVAAPWWQQIWLAAPHLLLPIACLTLPSLAYISRQARSGMANALAQDYIRTARAKGLPERTVIWRHGFRNALFPLITLLASVVPSAIAGSVAIEWIFDIPGMGWLTLKAINQQDWPIVFTVLMLGAVLTVVGMLAADVLYRWTDPRVKY